MTERNMGIISIIKVDSYKKLLWRKARLNVASSPLGLSGGDWNGHPRKFKRRMLEN